MERLTEKVVCNLPDKILDILGIAEVPKEDYEIKGTNGALCCELCEVNQCSSCPIKKVIDKLADYEDAEEQGLLLRLPCPLGTEIYCIHNGFVEKGLFFEMSCFKFKDYYKKSWFLTKEEAEQALTNMKGV